MRCTYASFSNPYSRRLTGFTRQALSRPPYNAIIPPSSRAKLEIVKEMGSVTLKNAHEAGVNIAYGTDTFSAMQPLQLSEFDLRAKILPSPVVLKHATCNAGTSSLGIQSGYSTKGLDLADMGSHVAKVLKMEGKIGCVTEGAFADLLLLSANPLEDVTIFNKPAKYVKGIIKDGRVVTSRLDGLKVEVSLM